MTTGLLTDAACDLPARFLSEQQVEIMPIHLHLRDQVVADVRKVPVTLGFYKSYLVDKDMPVETSPLSVEEMAAFFEALVPRYDNVIFVSISRTRSKIYEYALEACAGMKERNVHIIDSQTLFTGQGILVYEAVRALKLGMSHVEVVQHIQNFVHSVHSFLVPEDLYYLRTRARKKGDGSIGLLRYLVGSALDVKPIVSARLGDTEVVAKTRGFDAALEQVFDKAIAAIEKGLAIPAVVLSYAGDPRAVAETYYYRKLAARANREGVDVMVSVMSPAAGINVGPGALALSYAIN